MKVITEEHGCAHIAGALSYLNGNPLALARWTPKELSQDLSGYFGDGLPYRGANLVLQGVGEGDKVVILEDILSHGKTVSTLAKLAELKGASIKGIYVIAEKLYGGRHIGRERLDGGGRDVESLIEVEVSGEKSKIEKFNIPDKHYSEAAVPFEDGLLHDSLDGAELIRLTKSGRNFLLNPLTEQFPHGTSSALLRETVKRLSDISSYFPEPDKVVTEFDRCAHIIGAFAIHNKLPIGGARWFPGPVHFKSLVSTEFEMEYFKGSLFGYGINKGDRVLLIDDAVSTGGTGIGAINLIHKMQGEIVGMAVVFAKKEYEGVERIKRETGIEVNVIYNVSVEDRPVSKVLD